MARIYATAADYLAFTGQTPPAGIEAQLARAARFLDSEVFRLCWYDVDAGGLPSNPLVLAAFRDAVCAQVAWWVELGDSTGAAGVGWSSVGIGSVSLSRQSAGGAEASAARQVAPEVGDLLRAPDLTPDVLLIGAVVAL